MRVTAVCLLLIAALGLCGCESGRSQQTSPKPTIGFWFWQGSSADEEWSGPPVDALFVQVGTISKQSFRNVSGPNKQWNAYGQLPERLPPAREYWLVYRYEMQGVPDVEAASIVTEWVQKLLSSAARRHLNVVGLQLDIDSPTRSLPQYATFLREVRKGLPPGFGLSVTALLDWFRDGTGISDVVQQVDEFVPQFYDVGGNERGAGAIAANIDAAKWGPIFNRFGKRFRIGISTFGRARMVPREDSSRARKTVSLYGFVGGVTPLDIASSPAFQLQSSRTPAGEFFLTYHATRRADIGYNSFETGDAVQFTLPTPEAVQMAAESARRMAGLFAGVIFFRWPSANESLAMLPEDVLAAAGRGEANRPRRSSLIVSDGECAAVHCVDLFLQNPNPFSPQVTRYRVRSSTELEYFLPEEKMPARMSAAAEVEVVLPPYCGRGQLYLGRAVTVEPATYTVEAEK